MKQLTGSSGADASPPSASAGAGPGSEIGDVRIRPYWRANEEPLRRMSGRMSSHSLHARFFTGTPRVPEKYLRTLRELDHWDHEATIALLDGEVLGIAEYIRHHDRGNGQDRGHDRAELAVLIADPWQRLGLARRLVIVLAGLARRRGITHFSADVLLDNRRARSAIRGLWPVARPRWADGVARYDLPLAALPPLPPA